MKKYLLRETSFFGLTDAKITPLYALKLKEAKKEAREIVKKSDLFFAELWDYSATPEILQRWENGKKRKFSKRKVNMQ